MRLGDIGDHGGQVVVVAEFDFIHGDGVVFVDDGDDAPFHQGRKRVADVEKPFAVGEVAHGQQDLGHVEAVLAECVGIDAHEPALADGRSGLFLGHALQGAGNSHAVLARGDGSGRHDDDMVTFPGQFDDFIDELLDEVQVQAVRTGQDGAADLDDDFFYVLQRVFSDVGHNVFTTCRIDETFA